MEVSTEMANRMSLFYAYPTPFLKTLSDATGKFVSDVRNSFLFCCYYYYLCIIVKSDGLRMRFCCEAL